jgi:hypothetical protein
MEEIPFDPKRRLCPDGACVGVLGADGRCSVCQRPASGSAAWLSEVANDADADVDASESDASESDVSESDDDASTSPSGLSASDGSSGFDAHRRLCDDGSCVGVVGADGICGTCGKKAE